MLKNAESRCQQLYQDLMDSKKEAFQNHSQMQQKIEEAQEVISKQLAVIDTLNQKLSQVKDLSNQQDFTWG